jgi:hypothetical protein
MAVEALHCYDMRREAKGKGMEEKEREEGTERHESGKVASGLKSRPLFFSRQRRKMS